MNGRRGFMRTLVGAFVASAIEIRLAAAPVIEALAAPVANYVMVWYFGEAKWINASMEDEWTGKYGKGGSEL